MAEEMLSEMAAGTAKESAGVEALRLAKRKAVDHLASASKELGQIAAQYGRLIDTYQQQINQIDVDIDKLTGLTGLSKVGSCEANGAGQQLATTRLR